MYCLSDHTAIVTGGAQGIGFGIAQELTRAGARVVICDRNLETATYAAKELTSNQREAVALALDVTNEDSVQLCVRTAISMFARVHIVVNNAGIHSEQLGSISTVEQFNRCFDVNLLGVWRVTQAIVPHFKTHGGGRIVNIASINGRRPSAELPAYCASKAAVISITRSLALKLGVDNINVNAVCPGGVLTPMNDVFRNAIPNMEGALLGAQILKNHPLQPQDIGCAVAFLASPQARNITGQSLNVDAGALMS